MAYHLRVATADMPELALREAPKARGAFFTPPRIAEFLATWAIAGNRGARVLDPTSGEGVFLQAAGQQLRALGMARSQLPGHVHGFDIHVESVQAARHRLTGEALDAHLEVADFFTVAPPRSEAVGIQAYDAVIGNPPYVRYQQHCGEARRRSAQAALQQGVRLSGLASSWAALLIHAGAFLRPEGRLAMVLPAELLTVHYAEPVRRWLRERFHTVRLMLFESLQFSDALENVVLLLANGSGGTDSFTLRYVRDGEELGRVGLEERVYTPARQGKWTDLLLSSRERHLFQQVARQHFVKLGLYGTVELGTVTGSNSFFTLSEETRRAFDLGDDQVRRVSPPGTRHLRGLTFTNEDWDVLRQAGEPVWLLCPSPTDRSQRLQRYLAVGHERGIDKAYKCRVRSPWWRPPMVKAPDLFFTYMSHRCPRLITNVAGVSFLNSMHGLRLCPGGTSDYREALPLLVLNSLTMMGAELYGRSYGGGVLKMEPREAMELPVPAPAHLHAAWTILKDESADLDAQLRQGVWGSVVSRVDEILLHHVMRLPDAEVNALRASASLLRSRRTREAMRTGRPAGDAASG